MPGTPYPLGPFKGGMNNEDEESTIGDDQLADVFNFELDNDGSLFSRPAFMEEADTPVAGQFVDILGYYVRSDGSTFAVCTTDSKTWIYDINTEAFTEIWAAKASGFCQYDNKIVLISASVTGGYWESGVFTAMPTMPIGDDIVVYQERFWAYGVRGTANQTTVWFSNITSAGPVPTSIYTWTPASDFFEVNKGDGQWVTGLLADTNALIIFRNRSTWRLSYSTTPFKGDLGPVNAAIGADNKDCFGQYESYYIVLSQGILYQFINYQYYPLNTKRIRFEPGAPSADLRFQTRVGIFAHRAVVWYHGNLYVYSMNTDTWSRWGSPTTGAGFVAMIPPTSIAGDVRNALAISGVTTGSKKMLRIIDDVLQGADGEAMTCFIKTKAYSLDEAAQYKRLFYWTFEVKSSSGGRGLAIPYAIAEGTVTTDQMDDVTTDILDLGSVDNPLIIIPTYETDVDYPTASPVQALIRAGDDNRFRRIRFEVYLDADGTVRTAPARIYSITPYMRIKGHVAKKVS